MSRLFVLVAALLALTGVGSSPARTQDDAPAASPQPDAVTVVASGLTSPRGFTWDAAGALHLALAGSGGPTPVPPPSHFMAGKTGSVVQVIGGCPVPVAAGLPSGFSTASTWVWGPADVAFLDGQLYVLSAGGGADFGDPNTPNGVYRVDPDGGTALVADLSAWFRAHPTTYIPPDYNQDGSLFSMEAGGGALWISEAVGGRLLRVTPGGAITLVADLSPGHPVPTGLALAPDGIAYVGFLTPKPFPNGAAKVVKVVPDGTVTDAWTGLTAVTGVALGPDGTLYAAEMATGNTLEPPFVAPGTGRVLRQTGPDSLEALVTDAEYPVGLGFGPDGALYLTYPAFAPNAGEQQGALLRIDLSTGAPVSLAGLGELAPTCQGGPGMMRAVGTPGAATPAP